VGDEKGLANGGTVMLAGALVAMAASTNFEEEGAVDPWDWHQGIIEGEKERGGQREAEKSEKKSVSARYIRKKTF
jgi:hypothetical protein